MSPELDEMLVVKYPKIFTNRFGDMTKTLMCWGFSHGDGWYNILDRLCSNIQSHINWTRSQRASALRYNRAVRRSTKEDQTPLVKHLAGKGQVRNWHIDQAAKVFEDETPKFRPVPEACSQVVAVQVKEKFGTLRFYYEGGDKVVDGMVRMAESMSDCTCEECGAPGETGGTGWLKTLCEKHRQDS